MTSNTWMWFLGFKKEPNRNAYVDSQVRAGVATLEMVNTHLSQHQNKPLVGVVVTVEHHFAVVACITRAGLLETTFAAP